MKRFVKACIAGIMGLALTVLLQLGFALAETQVLESDVPDLPVGAKIADEIRINIPEGKTLRVLIESEGETKTLQGPYEGTVANYKDDLSWWERLMGRRKNTDAPIGATRGLIKQ